MRYVKKPVEIEAIQLRPDTWAEVIEFLGDQAHTHSVTPSSGMTLVIHTLEGDMTAKQGDYIIKGVQGEFYPCRPDIFESTYEAVVVAPDGTPHLEEA